MDQSLQEDDPPLPVAHSFRLKLLDNVLTQIDKSQKPVRLSRQCSLNSLGNGKIVTEKVNLASSQGSLYIRARRDKGGIDQARSSAGMLLLLLASDGVSYFP